MSYSTITLYNLSGEATTLYTSVHPGVDQQYWGPPTIDAPSPVYPAPAIPITITRDDGLELNGTYFFMSFCEIDGVNVGIQVQLDKSILGTKMSQCLFAGDSNSGWWSSNDQRVLPFTGASGKNMVLEVSLITRIGCLDSDFILTVSNTALGRGQSISVGKSLFSGNGLLNLTLQPDGLALYRTEFDYPLWGPTNPGMTTASTAIMQEDGNFVVYDAQNNPLWETATADPSNPGFMTTLGSDGNLCVWGMNYSTLWSTKLPAIDWTSPTFGYTESSGYSFVETSENWKQLCQYLPCCLALQWPDYETAIFETQLNGEDAVIQVWRGFCPQFLNKPNFPGGVGGEVGVYRRIPGKALPASFPGIPQEIFDSFLSMFNGITDLWWPAPELVETIEFSLINLENGGSVFFDTRPEPTYWNCKWMSSDSYADYQASLGSGKTPPFSDRYQMDLIVNGQAFTWPGE